MAIDTLTDLVAVIAALPAHECETTTSRLERVITLSGQRRELALGLLALDLVPAAQRADGPGARPAPDLGRVAC